LRTVLSYVAENVVFLMHFAGWVDAPGARFRLRDECDDDEG
jgi:hypothetical protein